MYRRIGAAALATAMLLLAAAPGVTAQNTVERPWSGSSVGQTWFDVSNPKDCAAGITTRVDQPAIASHFGRAFLVTAHCPTGDFADAFGDADFTLIAANGDAVFGTYVGTIDGYSEVLGEEIFGTIQLKIMGGDGRFEGASGTAVMTFHTIFEGYDDLSWAWWASWNGTLTY
jgi:hypothetical protein